MTTYCTHADCRAHTAEELLYLAERLHRPEQRRQALAAHARVMSSAAIEVRCRRVPRRGPVATPFFKEST